MGGTGARVARRALCAALGAIAAVAAPGCTIGYLTRAAYEEGRILWNRKPISAELADADLAPDIRAKLDTVLQVRRFAADQLGLNVGGAYETISPIDQGAIVYVVMAAPRDSLQPYLWWFPIVGSVPYRGYFEKADADAEAAGMEAAGYDTLVRPAIAFSSLGFFDDPVLSNLLKLDRVELADVLIHELFHRTYYLAGHAMFDESAATWVGARGAAAFFAATEGESAPDTLKARAMVASNLKFANFLLQEQARLLRIYMSGEPKDQILKRRKAAFAEIQSGYTKLAPTLSGLDRFDLDQEPLNNAVLINYLIYFHDLDNFDALNRIEHGDVRATIERIIALAKSNPADPFYAVWQAVRNPPPPSPAAQPSASASTSTRVSSGS